MSDSDLYHSANQNHIMPHLFAEYTNPHLKPPLSPPTSIYNDNKAEILQSICRLCIVTISWSVKALRRIIDRMAVAEHYAIAAAIKRLSSDANSSLF